MNTQVMSAQIMSLPSLLENTAHQPVMMKMFKMPAMPLKTLFQPHSCVVCSLVIHAAEPLSKMK